MAHQRLEPAYTPLSRAGPTPEHLELDKTLKSFMDTDVPLEDTATLKKKEEVLVSIEQHFKMWVKDVCKARGMLEASGDPGGRLYTSGSYRLGIHEPGADIDTVCVAPMFCTRKDFFETLAKRIQSLPQVTNFNAIEAAAVPIMSFFYDGIDIDLGFASLAVNSIGPTLDIDDDATLDGVDIATEKALNGPRVTNRIAKLVGEGGRHATFLTVVRCVRLWAKRRGLYSNKLGYFGGVNVNILVCLVCQLYPKGSPSFLLTRFFKLLRMWKWPNPVRLVPYTPPRGNFEEWNPRGERERFQVMPIITPAYPAMNSMYTVNHYSLATMREEFERGWEICQKIEQNRGEGWNELFKPSEFFAKYSHYLAVDIIASSEHEFRAWKGLVTSRLRLLVERLGYQSHGGLKALHLFPREFEQCCSGGINGELPAHCACYFIGFEVDKNLKKRKQLTVASILSSLEDIWKARAQQQNFYAEGMAIVGTHIPRKSLPNFVFESLGGPAAAAQLRNELLEHAAARRKAREEEARAILEKRKAAVLEKRTAEAAAAAAAEAAASAVPGTSDGAMAEAVAEGAGAAAAAADEGRGIEEGAAEEEEGLPRKRVKLEEGDEPTVGTEPLRGVGEAPAAKRRRRVEDVSGLAVLKPRALPWRQRVLATTAGWRPAGKEFKVVLLEAKVRGGGEGSRAER